MSEMSAKSVAILLRNLARDMERVADELRMLPVEDATLHAKELTGAARVAVTWAQKLEKLK